MPPGNRLRCRWPWGKCWTLKAAFHTTAQQPDNDDCKFYIVNCEFHIDDCAFNIDDCEFPIDDMIFLIDDMIFHIVDCDFPNGDVMFHIAAVLADLAVR